MSKPTFIQSLLKQPSRTYLQTVDCPKEKDYYTAKPELLRIAAEEYQETERRWSQMRASEGFDFDRDDHGGAVDSRSVSSSSGCTLERIDTTTMAPMASPPQVRREPPRAASATIAAAMQQRHPSINSVVASTNQNSYQGSRNQRAGGGPASGRTRAPPLPKGRNIPSSLDDDSDDLDGFDSSDDDNPDIFFTPAQSPRTSMASSSIAFPSRRNASPRQATRRSLRMSHASSGVVVAPGIAASNSGSSIKPSPSHVNSKEASTTTTTAAGKGAAPMPHVTPTHQQPNPASNGSTSNRRPTSGSPAQQPPGKATAQPQQQQQPSRKPTEPSSSPRPAPASNQKPAQPPLSVNASQNRTPTNDAKRTSQETPTRSRTIRSSAGSLTPDSSFNSSPAATANAGATASTSSSQTQRTPTIPKRTIPPAPSNRSSGLSLTSTTLENHSDVFSITNSEVMSRYSTTITSPVQSPSPSVARKPAPPSNGAESKSSAVRSNSLRSTRTPASGSRNLPAKPIPPRSNGAPVRNYSYTDDDWRKETESLVDSLVSNRQSLVDSAAVAQAYLDREATEEKYGGSPVKRKGSVKRDEHGRNLGAGQPAEVKSSKPTNGPASPAPLVDSKGKDKEKSGKLKRKKTGTSGDQKDVVHYIAKYGTPMPPPSPLPESSNGAANGTKSYSPPASPPQLPPKSPTRNGLTHVPQASLMMNMRTFIEEDDESIARLSAVTEREEPIEPPTQPISGNTILPGGILTSEPHTSALFNAFSSLRPTANNARPIEMVRRRSRSLTEQDLADDERSPHPRQSSVMSWADEYKDILAKSRGKAMASGTSLFSSPSEQSFAYRSAVPVASGELPSNGTPGYTALRLPHAPPPMMSPSNVPPNSGFLGGLKSAVAGGPSSGPMSPNGKIDLTRSGMAQTTMASVEVIKGLGSVKRGLSGVFSSLGRRRTVSGGEGTDLLQNRRPARLRKGSADVERTQGPSTGKYSSGMSSDRILGFTAHRTPPTYVPSGSVLVQVWAVSVDGTDAKLTGLRMGRRKPWLEEEEEEANGRGRRDKGEDGKKLGRSLSLRERLGSLTRRRRGSTSRKGENNAEESDKGKGKARWRERDFSLPPIPHPDVGFIPGRSFVGRVLDCGWDVKEEQVRKGDLVAGLLDVRRCGALAEFIVVDRHRVHRVPHPGIDPGASATSTVTSGLTSNSSGSSSRTAKPYPIPTLAQLALLPLCGVPAYRAVQTLVTAFAAYNMPSSPTGALRPSFLGDERHLFKDHEESRKRRALVLRGHDGTGAMAVQMLALRGWRVSVHVPINAESGSEEATQLMALAEERAQKIGGEEVVFDDGGQPGDPWWDDGRAAAVRLIHGLTDDGDVFDAVIDTIGGKEIREASERLLRSTGKVDSQRDTRVIASNDSPILDGHAPLNRSEQKAGIGQFTTLVGEVPERVIPTTADSFRAGLRSLKLGGGGGGEDMGGAKTKVGYAWISVAQDVDWEGEDIAATIGNVVRLALEHNVIPLVKRPSTADEYPGPEHQWRSGIMPFEKTPEIFINGDGPLCGGGTMVINIAGP